jgi:hypothetical protein
MAPGGVIKSIDQPAPVNSAGGGDHFSSPAGSPVETKPTGGEMDKEELKAKYPDLYAAIFAEGKEAGVKDERERVEAHLKLGEDCGNLKIAAKFIAEGETLMSNKVQAEYMSARMNSGALNARNVDNPPPINGAGASGGAADDAALEAAWDKGLSGKDLQGVK